MFVLDRRTCELAAKHTGDVKEVDGKQIRTLTFSLEDVMLTKAEFNRISGEPLAWDALYNTGAKPVEPLLKRFKAMELDEKIESAVVHVIYGLNEIEAKFTACELSKIKLMLCNGGKVAMSCRVTTIPVLDDDELAALINQFGNSAECEIRAELPSEQADLPLNQFGENEQHAH